MPLGSMTLSDDQLNTPLAEMVSYGLSLRNIGILDDCGSLYVGEVLGLRLEEVLRQVGTAATVEIIGACDALRLGEKVKADGKETS